MLEKFNLGITDYVIFALTVAIFAGTGVYFSVFTEKQKTTKVYLFAGKDMSILPVAFSLMATFMSNTAVMGIPAEMYLFGTQMAFINIGFLLGLLLSSYVFLPIYFNNGVSTAYEYLEKRFGKSTRRILSGIFLFQYVFYNGVLLYAPALAMSAVTNLSMWTCVISIGIVCTFYCTVGGMKAILWTDVFQAFLMYTCLLAVIIKGCIDLGGIGNIFRTSYDGGRLVIPTFRIDFSTRYTIWSVFLQGFVIALQTFGTNQIQVQRQLTLRNLRRSRIATIMSAPLLIGFQVLSCFCGLILYVAYKSCDPVTSPSVLIHSADQLMPYYIISVLGQYPGLPGLCIAGIFSASFSTVSSAINSMVAVTQEDIIRSVRPNLSGSVLIAKVTCIIYGALCILMSYFVENIGNIYEASLLTIGMVIGPSLGVYILAAFTNTANEMGANLGAVLGFLLAGSLTFIPNKRHYPLLPVGRNCTETSARVLNFTDSGTTNLSVGNTVSEAVFPTDETFLNDNFPLSYLWITPLSLVVCVVVGYSVSWITSRLRGKTETVPLELLSPLYQ